MMKFLPLLLVLAAACTRATPPTAGAAPCLDPAKIRKDALCTMQYDPVCGCNNVTYGNACMANNAGVLSFVPGACPDQASPTIPR